MFLILIKNIQYISIQHYLVYEPFILLPCFIIICISTRCPNDNSTENTELANTLLSLGGKHVNSETVQKSKEANTMADPPAQLCEKPDHQITSIPSDTPVAYSCSSAWIGGSSAPMSCNSTWNGGSAAIIGFPFTYGINHMPHCSCTSRYVFTPYLYSVAFHVLESV